MQYSTWGENVGFSMVTPFENAAYSIEDTLLGFL
jgi:hypothetical protein